MENYSVLMSVYYKERPEFLQLSVESMFSQSVPTDDFVLMCDGPLTDELDAVIAQLQSKYGCALHVVRHEVNRGLSYALNDGLAFCKNDLVARMDSDDIAPANRCHLQLCKFAEDSKLDIVGGAIDEFQGSPSNVISHKDMPLSQDDILHYAKSRNPFNHPTVMFRKAAVLGAGGYPHFSLHEDYALWAKLLAGGSKGCNLPQTLCYMRVDNGLYNRRGGLKYFKNAAKFRYHLYRSGFYSLWNFIYVTTALAVVCLIPQSVRRVAYLKVLRKNS